MKRLKMHGTGTGGTLRGIRRNSKYVALL